MAALRANGNEFDVARSGEVMEEIGSDVARKPRRKGRTEVA
jgi:hypothetical protein